MHFLKFKLLFLFLLLILHPVNLKAQYHSFSVDAFKGLIHTQRAFKPMYERSLGKNFSGALSFEIGQYSKGGPTQSARNDRYKLTGFGFMPQFRYYPFTKKRPAPFGFFLGTHLRYRRMDEHYSEVGLKVNTKGNLYDFGANIGYKFFIGIFNLEILLGKGIMWGNFDAPNSRSDIPDWYRQDIEELTDNCRIELSLGFHFPKFKKELN